MTREISITSVALLVAASGVALITAACSADVVIYPGATWETATPQEAGMDPAKFDEAMAALPSPAVVVRNGKIIGSKGDVARSGNIWSGSKPLIALIVARLVQQGQIELDTLVPGSNVPTDPLASYRQFLSMTSDFQLSPHSPGNHYAYNNGAFIHCGDQIKNTYFPGKTHVEMLKDAYMTTIGSEDHIGFDGYVSGWSGGWSISTRDLARVGYLVLRKGSWNGQQILPASFVSELYKPQITDSAVESPDAPDGFYNETQRTPQLHGAYSFGFWLPHKGPALHSQSTTEAVAVSGAFGTTVYISRATDLVIAAVNTSQEQAEGKIPGATLDLFAKVIIRN